MIEILGAVGPVLAWAAGLIGVVLLTLRLVRRRSSRMPTSSPRATDEETLESSFDIDERFRGPAAASPPDDEGPSDPLSPIVMPPMPPPPGVSLPRALPSDGVPPLPPPPATSLPPAGDLPPALKPREYRVWFGTNRRPVDPENFDKGFSGERGGTTRYGYCNVYVPESHKLGSIGSSLAIRVLTWTDDRLKITRIARLDADRFWGMMAAQLGGAPAGQRHAVVFIHGYNVSFEAAALRAAQIGYDLGIAGAMAFFSWPSKGSYEGYPADEASIDASEGAITDFLVDFARRAEADAVHVIAHSMGNRGLLRAVARIAQRAEERSGASFGQCILAAPDVDADIFMQMAAAYRDVAKRTTLYVSARDRAVSLSRWLHGYPRVGFAPPIAVFDSIDTVNVTDVDMSLLGHGYVAEERAVLSDMHSLIFHDLPPEQRFTLTPARTENGEHYWVVRG